MIKALAIKELREILGIALLGLAAELFLVAGVIGVPPFRQMSQSMLGLAEDVPFIGSSFFGFSCIAAAALAIALGFRQSAWENGKGAYQFLLHRPLRRETIFLTKLGIGVAVFLACVALPILLYALWAAVPGTHPSPFQWSMTSRSWQACLIVPLLYAGAFLSGLRPGRRFGTQLLPLVATTFPTSMMLTFPLPWLVVLPLLLMLYGALVTNICYVARMREYS